MTSYKCNECNEEFNDQDELIFFLSGVEVYVEESHPDWDKCVCDACYESEEFWLNKQSNQGGI